MLNRNTKGVLPVVKLLAIVIAIFVLFVVFSPTQKIFREKFYPFFNFFGFDLTQEIEGVSIVGLNLNSNKLNYYTGEKWKEFKKTDESFRLAEYEFLPKEVGEKLTEFYEETPRDPKILNLNVNDWRYWQLSFVGLDDKNLIGLVGIDDFKKSGYEGFEKISLILSIDGSLSLDSRYSSINLDNKLLNNVYRDQIPKVVTWRDQILSGNACEKFISFDSLKLDGNSKKNNQYTIAKVGPYLFVDFEKKVEDGVKQRYEEGCFDGRYENYDDKIEDRSYWRNQAQIDIEIRMIKYGGLFGNSKEDDGKVDYVISWKPDVGWEIQIGSTKGKNYLLSSEEKVEGAPKSNVVPNDFRIPFELQNDFYLGLKELSRKKDFRKSGSSGGTGRNGLSDKDVAYISVRTRLQGASEKPFYESDSWEESQNEINLFNYKVLDEYNKYFRSELSEDYLNAPSYVFVESLDDDVLSADLYNINIISQNPINQNNEYINRIMILNKGLGVVDIVVFDNFGNKIIGDVDSNGLISIEPNFLTDPSYSSIRRHLEAINGLSMKDRYYFIAGGGVGNVYAIEKKKLPDYFLGVSL